MSKNKSNKVAPIALDKLKSYLWGAAVLLRGQIDATGYKEYIFPLLFFKRISDVYDEEYSKALEESGGDEEYAKAALHAITIPDEVHWKDVRMKTENIGQALVMAFTRIEQANPAQDIDGRMVGGLTGIFGEKRIWTNKDSMPDRLLADLLEHFSKETLSLAACPADEMGTGYEYLVGKFADDAGHTAQEFYTNRTVVDLMTKILKPQPSESIYDPTCGSGGMLIKCLTSLKDQNKEWRDVKVYGQELNALTAAIARMNLFLHGVEDFTIANEDTLVKPAFIKNGKIQKFDIVLANPPYSIKQWNREGFASDSYGRNIWGTPPQGRADYAFFQHIVSSMKKETGRCAILFPHGILFRDEEREMRRKLVKSDILECIIGLGPNLFFNASMEACIVICNMNKPSKRQNKVLFIDAKDEVTRKNAQSNLGKKHISKIVNAFDKYETIPSFSILVDKEAIINNNSELRIALYIHDDKMIHTNKLNVEDCLSDWKNQVKKTKNEVKKLINIIG